MYKIELMKKFLSILIFSMFLCGNASSDMNKISKIRILVEETGHRSCNVYRENLEITTKYILSNSKLEISKITEDYNLPYLYVQPIIMESNTICTGALNIFLKKNHMIKDGSYNNGDFIYYFNNTVIFKSGKTEFKRYFIETLEEELKKFVVEWNEYNK